jgi:hypothetical protein
VLRFALRAKLEKGNGLKLSSAQSKTADELSSKCKTQKAKLQLKT